MPDSNWQERLIKLETKFTLSIDNLNTKIDSLSSAINKLAANQERLDAFIVQQANINHRLNNVEEKTEEHRKEDIKFHENIRDHLFSVEKRFEEHQAKIQFYFKLIAGVGGLLVPVVYTILDRLISKWL